MTTKGRSTTTTTNDSISGTHLAKGLVLKEQQEAAKDMVELSRWARVSGYAQ